MKMIVDMLKGKKVAVAVSGGMDSVVLLHKLLSMKTELDIELSVINIDHGIRANSAEDSEFVRKLATEWNLPFVSFVVDAPKYADENGLSEETAARVLRYNSFEKSDSDFVAIAHHMSDQAESIIMHILRGCGANGARGMSAVSGKYVRPMLDTSKEEIENYIKDNNLSYVIDQTNFENDKTRNFLRNVVFEDFKKINQNAIKNICKFGKLIDQDELAFEKNMAEQTLKFDKNSVEIPFSVFEQPPAISSRWVFRAVRQLGVFCDVEQKHVEEIVRLAKEGNSGNCLCLPCNLRVFKDYDCVTISLREDCEKTSETLFEVGEVGSFGVLVKRRENEKMFFDLDKIPAGCVVRNRKDGDVFEKFGGGTKKLKEFLIDKKIPQRNRDKLVLVAKGNEVFVVVGVEVSKKVAVDEKTKNIFVVNQKSNTEKTESLSV